MKSNLCGVIDHKPRKSITVRDEERHLLLLRLLVQQQSEECGSRLGDLADATKECGEMDVDVYNLQISANEE